MRRLLLALAVVAGPASSAVAQLPQTRLYSVFPPGIPPGQVTEVRINTGDDLDEVDRLLFNHPGIFATQKQLPDGQGGFSPAANTFRVAVLADVPPGRYEVRAGGRFGVSNARALIVDSRPSVSETEPNNTADQAQAINLGTLVDGQMGGAGDVDYVRVAAKQGQRLVVDCLAERIDSRLNPMLTLANADDQPVAFARNEYGHDAFLVYDVPADGDYLIKLHDEAFAGGGEHIYRLQVHTGPHIRFVMPPAGIAGATGRFSLYGYNLPGGTRVEQASAGAALERLDVEIPVPQAHTSTFGIPSVAAGLDLFPYRLTSDAGASNSVLLGIASAPVTLEQEPNDESAGAQKLTIPFEVAGQSQAAGDVDRFTFEAAKDQEIWIEVVGQREGVPLDPFLTVEQITVDANGVEQARTLTTEDDTGTNLAANVFDTASDDPAFRFKAPESGTYRLSVADRGETGGGDPALVYRLIARPPQPDFRLIAIPSGQMSGQTWSVSPRRGDHFALDILVFREEGFEGPIDVRPLSLPAGMSTNGTVIREKENTQTLILTASDTAPADPSEVKLVGSARVPGPGGETVIERPVRAGTVVWSRNGNTPAISQLETALSAVVNEELAPFQLNYAEIPDVPRIRDDLSRYVVHQGRQVLIPMTLLKRDFDEQTTLKFDDAAKKAKIDAPDVVFAKGESEKTSRLFVRPDAPPGTYVLGGTAQAQVPYRRNPQRAARMAELKAIAEQEAQIAKARAEQAAQVLHAQVAVVQQADAALQQAQQAQAAEQEKVNQAMQAMLVARQAYDEAVKQVAVLTEEIKQSATKSEDAAKAAAASEDEALKTAADEARRLLEEKQAALATAQQGQTQAAELLTPAEAGVKAANESLAAAEGQTQAAQAARQSADQVRIAVESRHAEAAHRAKVAEDGRAAAEKAANDAANAANPKNIAVNQPIPPIILTVRPAPVALEAKPAKGDIKPGEMVEVTVTVKRQNEFAGPVKLSLAVPPGTSGLSAAEFDVPAEAESGVLQVTATAETTEGELANLVVRAKMDAGGEAVVDAPLALKVIK